LFSLYQIAVLNKPAAATNLSIVHVIDRLHTGGAERVLVTLANIFAQHGHPVKVVTIAEKGPLAEQLLPAVEQINLGRTFRFDPLVMRRLIKEVKGYDVVHVHSFFNLRYLWLAKMLFGLNKPVFYHEHLGLRSQLQPTFWQKKILPQTIFISTTDSIAKWAAEQLHVAQDKVFILPNIVIKEAVPVVEKKGDGIIKLVLVSNIRREKNIEFGIKLLQQLNTASTGYHLTIIGKIYDGPYYTNLQQLITETNAGKAVSFINNADSVQQLLPRFDMALHTSPSESGPLSVIEYMAQGLPFVAYNTGEVIKLVEKDLSNCIASSFDVNEWINKVQQLQAVDASLLRQQLQATFSRYFSSEAYYSQCLAIYDKVLRN
jgi:glycosyltransferase involved in cell wall biosynthesis